MQQFTKLNMHKGKRLHHMRRIRFLALQYIFILSAYSMFWMYRLVQLHSNLSSPQPNSFKNFVKKNIVFYYTKGVDSRCGIHLRRSVIDVRLLPGHFKRSKPSQGKIKTTLIAIYPHFCLDVTAKVAQKLRNTPEIWALLWNESTYLAVQRQKQSTGLV